MRLSSLLLLLVSLRFPQYLDGLSSGRFRIDFEQELVGDFWRMVHLDGTADAFDDGWFFNSF